MAVGDTVPLERVAFAVSPRLQTRLRTTSAARTPVVAIAAIGTRPDVEGTVYSTCSIDMC